MHADLYVADILDTLSSGKMVAHGLFPDRVIVFGVPHDAPSPSFETPYGAMVSFGICVSGAPPGRSQFEVKFEHEDGEALPSSAAGSIDVNEGDSANILLRFEPFLAPKLGRCFVVLNVAGHTFRLPFEVRVRRAAPPPSA